MKTACLTANSRSTGPQQRNTDDHNSPFDNTHLPLTGGPQVLTTDDVGCLCATFHHVQQSCYTKTSVYQHGDLELYSVGDIEPVEFVVQYSRDKPRDINKHNIVTMSNNKKAVLSQR